jgi:hypothetical protein
MRRSRVRGLVEVRKLVLRAWMLLLDRLGWESVCDDGGWVLMLWWAMVRTSGDV